MPSAATTINSADPIWIDRAIAEKSLLGYARMAFPLLEPASRKFVNGWVLGVICEHLEAVTHGEIDRLLINVPPGCMKSMLTRVMWPTWEWGPLGMPGTRTIGASYAEALALRDNRRAKRVIESPWFQARWGDQFELMRDQAGSGNFANSQTGWMLATSVRGLGTGERGDRFSIDDPHNVREAESDAHRQEVLRWFAETVPTRINDDASAIVVIMQRVHELDVSGYILAEELPYTHLCLPMEWEAPPPTTTVDMGQRGVPQSTRYTDPRTEEGELLWPERFKRRTVDDLKQVLGDYGTAGQLQQRPSPRGGGMFPVEQFVVVQAPPPATQIERSVRYWDKAGSKGEGDYTSGTLMHKLRDGRWCIEDVVRGQWSALDREARIRQTAEIDGKGVKIWVEQEGGSGGKESAEATVRNLAGWVAKTERPSGSKESRADPYAAQVQAGNVLIVRGPWNSAFLHEHGMFPRGANDDQVDSSSGAFNKLNAKAPRAGVW